MPPVKVITIDKQTITEKDLKNKFNLFVVLFNPLCDHCQTLMVEMGKHVDEFPKNKVVFMAEKSMIDHLEFFKNVTRYTDYPHIMVGADSANFTGNAFIYQSMPQVNIYDKDRKLVKIFSGLTTTDSLKQYFK